MKRWKKYCYDVIEGLHKTNNITKHNCATAVTLSQLRLPAPTYRCNYAHSSMGTGCITLSCLIYATLHMLDQTVGFFVHA